MKPGIRSWLITWFFWGMPILLADYMPVTDLPQHVAQVQHFFEWLVGNSELTFLWNSPYLLGYLPLALFFPLGAVEAAQGGLFLAVGFWAAGLTIAATHFKRSAAVVFASMIFFYTLSTYWGFFPFLWGFPLFLLLVVGVERQTNVTIEAFVCLVGIGILYYTHALWAGVGCLWLFLRSMSELLQKRNLKTIVPMLAGIPWLLMGIYWSKSIVDPIDRPATWFPLPLERLGISLLEFTFGKNLTLVSAFVVIALLGAAIWSFRRNQVWFDTTSGLTQTAIALAVAALMFPSEYGFTISFASRFAGPLLAVTVLLVLDQPLLHKPIVAAASLFLAVITHAWWDFSNSDCQGLRESLGALPFDARVVQLDYRGQTANFGDRPFMHMINYAEAGKGIVPNFSFTLFPSVPMQVAVKTAPKWTSGLEWYPSHFKASDLDYFDYVLVNANSETHQRFAQEFVVVPVVNDGYWRLYATKD